MRIVVDMQGAQTTGSRHRGIGRYTLALSKEIARLRGEHEVILALNCLFPDTIEPIRAAFEDVLPQENIYVWEAVGPVNASDKSNDSRRRAAEISREAFLASLQPDIVLNTSLFEGQIDDAITSIGGFISQLPMAVILYDLIPLVYRKIYLQNPAVEFWYLNKLDHLRRADLLLSISASSGQEAVTYLGFPPEKVVNIFTACDSHFQPVVVDETGHTHLQKRYGLVRPFVMYTGGIDHRKNIEGLIRAYARLPKLVRAVHQLSVVCSIQASDRERLLQLAKKEGLRVDELVITGFVSENDLLMLYNACKMFVFASWHEGFGLPALEAMACGRAVIGSHTSSIPEVIGRADALFDPFDDEAIMRKMLEVLTNDNYRAELERHGLTQAKKFSWEQTARHAWQAMEAFVAQRPQVSSVFPMTARRPRLAYVSPLQPEQSGISDYSAELLPELSRHYEIEVVVAQVEVLDSWVNANCTIRDFNWFRANSSSFDRVLYQFGNSVFHSHMFDLIGKIPGVVVLHDFFLSDVIDRMDVYGQSPNGLARALVQSHGWSALQKCYKMENRTAVVWEYPCNLNVIQQALGVIVHSEYSCQLARDWYGPDAADNWAVIPLLRVPAIKKDRHAARRKLGVEESNFIVCSFGRLGYAKLNHRLLAAWLTSPLAIDPHCHLVFVGQNDCGKYGVDFWQTVRGSSAARCIEITDRVNAENYRDWLAVADVGVQLRTLSRGETSAAVLDCMNHALPTIVNANGSITDLPVDSVWLMPDEFTDEELIEAMATLRRDPARRLALGNRAKNVILKSHQPRHCAERYAEVIENYYRKNLSRLPALVDAIGGIMPSLSAEDLMLQAIAIASNFPPQPRRKQLLVDISELVQRDAKSGIQRTVRSILSELLKHPPEGYCVEPVYATSDRGYRYARRFTSRFLGIDEGFAEDEIVDAWPGDVFIGLDLQHVVVPLQKDYLIRLQRRGIKICFVVYDLLPVLLPQYFPDGVQMLHQRWLATISHFDGAVCISRVVADELAEWQRVHGPQRMRPFKIDWFHLGADLDNSVPTRGLPDNAKLVLQELALRPTFLTVSTIEPRKSYSQVYGAFESLWKKGVDANLVIVGKQGWLVESLAESLRNHPELNKRLFWLECISDEYLEKIYAASNCLIAASEGEGFGLPLIEAAQHKLPIIARDIPVFREVAGKHAFYFRGLEPQALTNAVQQWLELDMQGKSPRSDNMPWLTWKQSTAQLMKVVLGGQRQSVRKDL